MTFYSILSKNRYFDDKNKKCPEGAWDKAILAPHFGQKYPRSELLSGILTSLTLSSNRLSYSALQPGQIYFSNILLSPFSR